MAHLIAYKHPHTPAEMVLVLTPGVPPSGRFQIGSSPSLRLRISPPSAHTIRLASSTAASSGSTSRACVAAPPYSMSFGAWCSVCSRSSMRSCRTRIHWDRASSITGAGNAACQSPWTTSYMHMACMRRLALTLKVGLIFSDQQRGHDGLRQDEAALGRSNLLCLSNEAVAVAYCSRTGVGRIKTMT